MTDAEDLTARLERIQALVDQLAKARGDMALQQELAGRVHQEILGAKHAIKPPAS